MTGATTTSLAQFVREALLEPLQELFTDGALPGAHSKESLLTEALDLFRASTWGAELITAVPANIERVAQELRALLAAIDDEFAAIVFDHLWLVKELRTAEGSIPPAVFGDVARGNILGSAQAEHLDAVGLDEQNNSAPDVSVTGLVRTTFSWRLFDTLVVQSDGKLRFLVPTYRRGLGTATDPGPDPLLLSFDHVLLGRHDLLPDFETRL